MNICMALVFLVGAFALPVLPHAAAAAESQATYKVENLNELSFRVALPLASIWTSAWLNVIFSSLSLRFSTLYTGEEQALPKSSADKNGDPVTLKYEKIKNGVLVKDICMIERHLQLTVVEVFNFVCSLGFCGSRSMR
jgi:hypothetical protein